MNTYTFVERHENGLTEHKVRLFANRYASNNTLAVVAQEEQQKGFWTPFATLTVNLDGIGTQGMLQDEKTAFVDTNNCPGAVEFLIENGLAKDAGFMGKSGFCTYPLMVFDTDKF